MHWGLGGPAWNGRPTGRYLVECTGVDAERASLLSAACVPRIAIVSVDFRIFCRAYGAGALPLRGWQSTVRLAVLRSGTGGLVSHTPHSIAAGLI